ncbi:MAG: hypothetical protein ABSG30_18105 [Steroidobacteraceae bacterium]
MKFQRFIDGAVASDGGTISCRALLDDGRVFECGLGARIPVTRSERLIFVGSGDPVSLAARVLQRHSIEEEEFVAALQEFVNREPDKVAEMFLRAILDR